MCRPTLPAAAAVVSVFLCCVLQEPGSDGVSIQKLRVVGSASASSTGMQLFKPHQPAAATAPEPAANQRGLRGGGRGAAAASGSGVPIVRAVDVYLSVHVEGMPQQVRFAPAEFWHACLLHMSCNIGIAPTV